MNNKDFNSLLKNESQLLCFYCDRSIRNADAVLGFIDILWKQHICWLPYFNSRLRFVCFSFHTGNLWWTINARKILVKDFFTNHIRLVNRSLTFSAVTIFARLEPRSSNRISFILLGFTWRRKERPRSVVDRERKRRWRATGSRPPHQSRNLMNGHRIGLIYRLISFSFRLLNLVLKQDHSVPFLWERKISWT